MDRIDKLLEKYFRAETSLEEENELKAYFLAENIKPELMQYKPLFMLFEAERKTKFTEQLPEFSELPSKSSKNIYLRWISAGMSIAAVLLIAIILIKPQYGTARDYAILNGKYTDNEELVMQMASSKIESVSGVISRTMKPVENISKVRNSLEPVRKIAEMTNNNE
jgi:hypothetical protein